MKLAVLCICIGVAMLVSAFLADWRAAIWGIGGVAWLTWGYEKLK